MNIRVRVDNNGAINLTCNDATVDEKHPEHYFLTRIVGITEITECMKDDDRFEGKPWVMDMLVSKGETTTVHTLSIAVDGVILSQEDMQNLDSEFDLTYSF